MDKAQNDALRQSRLFCDLQEEAYAKLAKLASIVELGAGDLVFREGDTPQLFYVVLTGRCEVVQHSSNGTVQVLASLDEGSSIGELPLLDPGKRSATVRAGSDVTLAALPLGEVRRELFEGPTQYPYRPLMRQLEMQLVNALRNMNLQSVEALKQKNQMSAFVIAVISILCVFMFVNQWLASMAKSSVGTTSITLPVIVLIGVLLSYPIRALGMPWNVYGVTRVGWRRAVRDGLLFSIPVVLLTTAVKWLVVSSSASAQQTPMFDLVATLTAHYGSPSRALAHWVVFNVAYVVVVTPLQEFISRGLLQGLLERLLTTRHNVLSAIVVSNLIFSAFHLYLSVGMALITLVMGMYLGWLYTRTRNLIAPCLVHAIGGVWGLTVIRFQNLL